MSYRHLDEIDRAVFVAHKASVLPHLCGVGPLTRFLYDRWYVGRRVDAVAVRQRLWEAWSEQWTDEHTRSGSELLRLHLSCAPHTSLHAIGLVCERARTWDAPWRLTSSAVGTAVPAPDATVLYVPLTHVENLRPELSTLVRDLKPFLAGAVPALTLRIGRGAALAQNPADGRSFGEHRCRLVARSVLEHNSCHHRELVVRTLRAFDDAGIDPRRPYLEKAGHWDRAWLSDHAAA